MAALADAARRRCRRWERARPAPGSAAIRGDGWQCLGPRRRRRCARRCSCGPACGAPGAASTPASRSASARAGCPSARPRAGARAGLRALGARARQHAARAALGDRTGAARRRRPRWSARSSPSATRSRGTGPRGRPRCSLERCSPGEPRQQALASRSASASRRSPSAWAAAATGRCSEALAALEAAGS